MKEKNCAWCGNVFNYGRHKEKLFCSKDCLNSYQTHPLTRHLKSIQTKQGFMKSRGTTAQSQQQKDKMKEFWASKDAEYRKEHSEKTQKGKEQKYGDPFYFSHEKFKQTSLLKYQTDHPLKSKQIRDKVINTLKQKYGSGSFLGSELDIQIRNEKYKEKLISIFDNNNIQLLDDYSGIYDQDRNLARYNVKCTSCNSEFPISVNSTRFEECHIEGDKYAICRTCNPTFKSKHHTLIENFLKENNIEFRSNVKDIISPYELDIVIGHNLAIEINGNYWHSETAGGKPKNYHLNKTLLCEKNNIHLLQFFEDEIEFKIDIVKSMILSKLNKTQKIFARKCSIMEIEPKMEKEFLDQNHIAGFTISSKRIGLFYNEQLVAVMSFGSRKIGGDSSYELLRFANLKNHTIVGGFSKLLNFAIKKYEFKYLKTYADRRFSSIHNVIYSKHFKLKNISEPNYFYVDKRNYLERKHRFNFTKQKAVKKFNADPSKSEIQIMRENNYDRIFDCGNMVFELFN